MSGQLTALDFSLVSSSVQLFPAVGTVHIDPLGRKYQVVKATGSVAQYDFVSITKDLLFTAVGLSTTTNPITEPGQVGCYQGATAVVTGNYFFVLRSGAFTGKVNAATAINVKMYTTATVGQISTTAAASSLIGGLTATVSTGGAGSTTMFAAIDMVSVLS